MSIVSQECKFVIEPFRLSCIIVMPDYSVSIVPGNNLLSLCADSRYTLSSDTPPHLVDIEVTSLDHVDKIKGNMAVFAGRIAFLNLSDSPCNPIVFRYF